MSLIKKIKTVYTDGSDLTSVRLKSSKFVFTITSFLFFVNYFFVIASFETIYTDKIIFQTTLKYSYMAFLVSFFMVLYFLVKSMFFEKNKAMFFALSAILVCIFAATLLPLVVKLW